MNRAISVRGLFFVIILAGLFVLIRSGMTRAEAIPPEPGTVKLYSSPNHEYTIEIRILGYPDDSPSECTFKNSAAIIWSQMIPATPGKVAISDNGACIAMASWGWYDENGFRSLSIYNNKGELIQEIPFAMKWIHTLAMAPDGTYCMIGENGRKHARFSFYDCRTAVRQWEAEYGFAESSEVKIAANGLYILIATNDYDTGDMQFFLYNKQGVILWQRTLVKNYSSWDVPDYLQFRDNGKEFAFFDYHQGKFIIVNLPEQKGGQEK